MSSKLLPFVELETHAIGKVRACVDSAFIDPSLLQCPDGQIVEDVIFGSIGHPCDRAYVIEFFLLSKPFERVLQVPMNARVSFRWVPLPERAIIVRSGDQLLWRVAYLDLPADTPRPYVVAVFTRGSCRQSGRVIINQCAWQ